MIAALREENLDHNYMIANSMMPSEQKCSHSYRSIFVGFILFVLLVLFVMSFLGMDNELTTIARSKEDTTPSVQVHFKTEDTFEDLSNHTRQSNKDGPKTSFGRRRRGENYLLIYNNVPKTGSRTLTNAIRDSLDKHKPRIQAIRMPKEDRSDSQTITKILMKLEVPCFVNGHFPFVRLNRSNVLHINMARDPVERFVSAFYFAQNGDNNGVRPQMKERRNNITIDEYLQNNTDINVGFRLSSFFLSNTSEDEELNVQIAKQNIEKYYSLVGLTEDMDQVTNLLEKLFPDLLPGINSFYRKKNSKRKTATSTIGKVPPSAESVAILKKLMKFDYDLYEYIKGRFHDLRNEFRKKNL